MKRKLWLVTSTGLALLLVSANATAASGTKRPDEVTVFANVTSPAHPTGIVVHDGRVIVSTSAGSPFHSNTLGERATSRRPSTVRLLRINTGM